jgi:hypothetical protein
MAAAIRGIRLATGDQPPDWEFGVAVYVDFTATEDDWAVYHRDSVLTKPPQWTAARQPR